MSTTPLSVPNAIVETGTLACEAAVAASSIDRPDVRYPSESSTIRAGGAPFAPSAGTERIAASGGKAAPPGGGPSARVHPVVPAIPRPRVLGRGPQPVGRLRNGPQPEV